MLSMATATTAAVAAVAPPTMSQKYMDVLALPKVDLRAVPIDTDIDTYTASVPVTEADRAERSYTSMVFDPVRFAIAGGFSPDAWQARFLRSASKRRMLNCSRQVGKSTVVAIGAVHKAIYFPGSLILLLSPGERQSGELMRKAYNVLETSPHKPTLIAEGQLQMEFVNGSRIIALPGKEGTVRGYSAVDVLVVDEASRVPDDLFMAIEPMLAVSGGEMWTLSSPFGMRGWWYEQYKNIVADRKRGRKANWDYYEIPATMVPRIPPEFLAKQRRDMGEWWFNQEFLCMFMDAQAQAFGAAEIDAAFAEDVIAWHLEPMELEV